MTPVGVPGIVMLNSLILVIVSTGDMSAGMTAIVSDEFSSFSSPLNFSSIMLLSQIIAILHPQ